MTSCMCEGGRVRGAVYGVGEAGGPGAIGSVE